MTAPLVPRDLDLQDFPFMPVDIWRLFGSEFHARSDDAAWRAGLTLWLKSYHQVPASSMPNDDVALARAAELGRDLKTWKRIKADALRGWILCDDGRLYHPVVAEKALEGWIEKQMQIKSSEAGNAKRYGRTFDAAAVDTIIQDAVGRLKALNPNSRMLRKRSIKAPTGSNCEASEPPTGSNLPHLKPPKEREGKEREGKGRDSPSLRSGAEGERELLRDRFCRAYPDHPHPPALDGIGRELSRAITEGANGDEIVAGAKRYATEVLGRERRFVQSPVKWLAEGSWKSGPARAVDAAVDDGRIWHHRESPKGRAWWAWTFEATGRYPPGDAKGGWRFEGEWPPGYGEAAASDERVRATA